MGKHSHTHLEQGILRVQVEALFVRVDRCLPLTLAMQRGAQPRIALGPDYGFVFDSRLWVWGCWWRGVRSRVVFWKSGRQWQQKRR